MPATAPSGIANSRAPLTPSASPSVGPPDHPPAKRPRFRSTPSSVSATPSASNESTSSVDVNLARRTSTLRVLNTWAQLAERYNKRLDEDDVVDLISGAIIKDRGVLRGASRDYHFAQPDDQDYPDADQEDSEPDDDDNELNLLPPDETTTSDDALLSTKELLRGVRPLSASTDAEDLREFLDAEKERREFAGDEEDEVDMSQEQLSALRKALQEQSQRGPATADPALDVASTEHSRERQVDTTPTRPATHVPLSDDESEDELALWTHDESTAIYPVARDEPEQDVREAEQEVVELAESDSDAEFEALLVHPPRFSQVSPLPVPQLKEVQHLLQSPPDSERGRSKSRPPSRSKIKSTVATRKSESRPHSPEVIATHKRKPPVSEETSARTSDGAGSGQVVAGCTSPKCKGKGKEFLLLVADSHREKTPKPLGKVSQGQKRKRVASSSTSGDPLARLSTEPKGKPRNHGKSTSQSSVTLAHPDAITPALDKDRATPARFERSTASSSRSLPPFSSASKTRQSTLSVSAYRSPESDSPETTIHHHNADSVPLSDPPVSTAQPYFMRHPSHLPALFSPTQGSSGVSIPPHPPPPMDPVQAQQAHYLLAQAMHQLSYLISATMPYAAYASNPNQPWPHPPPPPPLPHTAYNTPVQHPPHFHDTRPYHTPSSSIPPSGLPPSSPLSSSVSSPVEEQGVRSRSRRRSKSRGRRVSFKLDSEEVVSVREHNLQPELHHSGQKHRKQTKGAGKEAREELGDSLRIEERISPPREIARGRTPGPPGRKKVDVPRSRSLSRRQ